MLAVSLHVSLCVASGQTSRPISDVPYHTASQVSAADADHLRKALEAYDAGQLAKATPALIELAMKYRFQVPIQTAAGMALLEGGNLAQGVLYLERARAAEPNDAALNANLGVAYLKLGRNEDALSVLREASKRDPANTQTSLALARALGATKHYGEAAAVYRGVAQSGNTLAADVRYDWALTLMNAGRAQDSITVLQATATVEQSAPMQELLGEAEEKSGQFQQAVGHFKRAAEIDASEDNLLAYGNELLQHWTFPAAVEIFRFSGERFPASQPLRMGLGVAYFGNNDFQHAAGVFHGLLVREPENAFVADMLGRSCSALAAGPMEDCAGLVAFAKTHPRNGSASLYAAIALLHAGTDTDAQRQAEALLRRAIAANERLPEAWYQLAVLQQQQGEWDGSATSLERAIALRPEYAEAHYRLSRAYGHTGKRAEAQQQMALQQRFAQAAKDADTRRMQEVITFLTVAN